jgi:predicted SnoaL-like aldol condensation-catalyzing enzyme
MKRSRLASSMILLCGLLGVAMLAAADPAATTNPKGRLAVGLLDMAFNQHKVKEAFDKYVGATYRQHNPFAPDGRDAAVELLGKWLAGMPEYKYEFKHVYVDGQIVIVHSHVTRDAKDRGSAVVDIFRLDGKNKIVEHWDVVQPIPEKPANDNTMF